MKEEEKIALFDAYLAKELNEADRLAFEDRLKSDVSFKDEFEAYLQFSQLIHDGKEYGEIKEDLVSIHENIFPDDNKKKAFVLRPSFLITVGIAASISLLILIANPFGSVENGDTAAEDVRDYQELTNVEGAEEASEDEGSGMEEEFETTEEDVDSTGEEDQTTSVSKLDEDLTVIDKLPKGSCFLISKNGYFITSKHLVRKRRYVKLQQKDEKVAFYGEVIYRDSILDFALLKCSEKFAQNFKSVPFKFYRSDPKLGDDVFTLGYPKSDIVYTTGVVSSERGFKSDSMSFEISMPSNPGNSGAPLFTQKGDLIGMVIANNSKKQSVTYILKPDYIQERIKNLQSKHDIDMRSNYTKRFSKKSDLIAKYRNFIFEIH